MGANGEILRARLPQGKELIVAVRRLQEVQRALAETTAMRDAALTALKSVSGAIRRYLSTHGKLEEGAKLPVGEKLYQALCDTLPPPSPPIGLG